ncbi:MAG: methylthioribose-phosphate isomerase [Solirubrobacteraceae bacterium]|jgi:methylthioribose-1-phosphate isomerase|nr:methylthioribose-phosphate isomerase [Solirubrobacteraceae bacterium]
MISRASQVPNLRGVTEDFRAAVAWTGDAVEIIDQTRLPAEEAILRLTSPEEVVAAIARLAVRGAPAIGICGAFGVVLAADRLGPEATAARLAATAAAVRAARPTAVNLAWAVDRVLAAARHAPDAAALRGAVEAEALAILAEDREACRLIGEHGRAELPHAGRLMTLCNTGRLATGGWGTALGVVYAKAAAGEPVEVLACETRPLLQGARLTAWELGRAQIPVTVLTEGAAAARLARGDVDAVIVGADRVAANGDTANKIGTYALAIAAHHHGVPFYVAVPRSTLDAATADGAGIEIEQRAGSEVRLAAGLGDEVAVWNPAFDVTPAALITAIICDAGVLRPPFEAAIGGALAGRLERSTA